MKGFKGYGILIFLLFWSAGAGAQVVLEGKVSSSEGEPLELAHVVAYKNGARKVAGFATTSKKGNYSLKLNEYGVYDVRYSFMGCKARMLTLRLEAGTKIFRKDVVLQVDEKMLSEVELVYNVPIKQSGDTTSYKAESFSSGKEKKLEDVLNNLPGVEVNDEGQVEVEGVQVQKVLVEGKNFFSGDSKLAAKNIPSNVVEEVQVIKNFTEVAMMKGLESTEDDIALNIKLKEGKKEFWFGETEAGGGVKEKSALYLVNPKLFYYSPDFNVSFIGSLTNTGRPPFTPRDFRALMGGSQKLNMKSGTSISGATNTLGLSSMRNNRAKQLDSEFGALNLSYSPSSSVDWSGFLIFSASDMLTEEYSLREYIKSGAREDNRQTVNQQSNLYVLKTEMNYHPDSDTQLDYELFVKYSDFSETLANQSAVNGQTAREIGENKEERPLSVLQNLTYYKTLAPAHILSVSGQYSYENENPYYSIETPDEVFPGLLPVDYTQDQARVVQDKTVKSHKLDTKADYFWKFDQLSNINLTLGNLYSRQQFSSSLFQTLADGKEETFGDEFSNDVSYTFSDLFLSARYRRQIGKVTLTPGLSVHQFYLADRQESTASSTEYGLLPSLNILTKFKSSVLLELDYA
ncbi:MAG: carboxypeptidase-like regulatory domain-containing protein, partial [Cytophagales bacterium]|nr:carboxypeptidase-like regulatory domain-containing protein [Cytophagales bacterium]